MNLLTSNSGRLFIINNFTEYISTYHMDEISNVMKSLVVDYNDSIVLRVDFMMLLQHCPLISIYLLNHASELLKLFDSGLTKYICFLLSDNNWSFNLPKCRVRLISLPVCEEISRKSIPKSADVGKFLSFAATVVRIGSVQALEYQREFVCRKCKYSFMSEFSEADANYTITPPKTCPNITECCISNSFTTTSEVTAPGKKYYKNRQEIRIQEQIKYLSYGFMPRTMKVVLDDDLIDRVNPGDDVIINGIVIRRWKRTRLNEQCDIELVILANEIQKTNDLLYSCHTLNSEVKHEFEQFWFQNKDRPFSARNILISNVCPLIYGMYFLKLALTLVLIGSPNCNFNGMKVRGESHMLLVGDPGTAKSQFLKFASKVMPRSVLTTGIGSTSAGLTVTAVKESSDWSLEAGALVLADGGICCIDEFSSIRESDKTAIHEAMEQQTISVAKAGIVCQLNTRCSVIAATNPKGNYDLNQSISCNTSIASPLLSRFDLIFLLLDNCNESWDRSVSDFILKHQSADNSKNIFNIDKLRSYLLYVKGNVHPTMSHDASIILEKYYAWMRQSDTTNSTGRITMRFLESLIRLTQSHARLMMRNEVQVEDAIVTIAVMESTIFGSSVLSQTEQLKSEFPSDADREYKILENNILKKFQIDLSKPAKQISVENGYSLLPHLSSNPIIKQTISNRKTSNSKLNKSVLDNFHISTQISTLDNQRNLTNQQPMSNKPFKNFLESIMKYNKTEVSDKSTVKSQTDKLWMRNENIFSESIVNQAELTDADFEIN